MNKRVISLAILSFVTILGCNMQEDSGTPADIRELTADYRSDDASLKVTGYGDWTGTDIDLVFSYQQGDHHHELVVNFEQWNASPDPRVEDFMAHMDSELVGAMSQALENHDTHGTPRSALFHHIQRRLLSNQVSITAGPGALTPLSIAPDASGEQCYCSYCKVHHAPYCR